MLRQALSVRTLIVILIVLYSSIALALQDTMKMPQESDNILPFLTDYPYLRNPRTRVSKDKNIHECCRGECLHVEIETPSDQNSNIDPSPVLEGVESIVALGVPGPLWALNPMPVPIVAGDDDTTPFPSIVAMVSGLGEGRVVAVGHEGFFTNEALDLLDNKQFGLNIVDWLNEPLNKCNILVLSGRGEWFGGSNFNYFKAELENRGYDVIRYSGTITPTVLSNISVVIIGNIWGEISDSEIATLKEFVDKGGGLFLIGLGWSWLAYRGPLNEYPMNRIAEPYGIRWIDGYIEDPTDEYDGHPIFHTFYPNITIQTLYQAFSYIENVTGDHPSDLPDVLQTNETLRRNYINAHLLIATATSWGAEPDMSSPRRYEIYSFYRDLINTYPHYFKKNVVYDPDDESAIAWIRERIYRSLIDALPLTEERKSEIASIINLTGKYLDIWNDFTVLILDNSKLGDNELNFIYNFLSLLPKGIHNMRAISVADYLGEVSPYVPLDGLEGDVNIFGVSIGSYSENPFPDDVPLEYIDGFCVVVIHEINHVVDSYYIQNNETLRNRRDELIERAGYYHLNYLRSMLPDGYFLNAPQEFFASISNQWFTNSCKTIELGLVRFDNGYKDPINQALFFADVYSMGKNFTYFYYTDTQGNIFRQKIPVIRDELGRIIGLVIGDYLYSFTLDQTGNVIDYYIIIDIVPPVLKIVYPREGEYIRGTITIFVNASDPSGIEKVEFYIDDSLVFTDYDRPYEYVWDTTGCPDGTRTIKVIVYDGVSNMAERAITITVDNTAPASSINHPANNTYVRGPVTISVTGEDVNLEEIGLYVNGTLLAYWIISGTYTYDWDTTKLADGSYEIRLLVKDRAGNVYSTHVIVTVDNTEPTIGELTISPEAPTEEDDVTVKVNVTDALSGVKEVILSYSTDGGATWSNMTMTLGPDGYYTATIPRQPAETTVLYKIYAFDTAGNHAMSPECSYTVRAKPAPLVIIASTIVGLAVIIALVVLWRRRGR